MYRGFWPRMLEVLAIVARKLCNVPLPLTHSPTTGMDSFGCTLSLVGLSVKKRRT